MDGEKIYRFIKVIDEPPKISKIRPNIYNEIIEELLNSGLNYAEVKVEELKIKFWTLQFGLKRTLKRKKINNIKVTGRKKSGKVYLVKIQ